MRGNREREREKVRDREMKYLSLRYIFLIKRRGRERKVGYMYPWSFSLHHLSFRRQRLELFQIFLSQNVRVCGFMSPSVEGLGVIDAQTYAHTHTYKRVPFTIYRIHSITRHFRNCPKSDEISDWRIEIPFSLVDRAHIYEFWWQLSVPCQRGQ